MGIFDIFKKSHKKETTENILVHLETPKHLMQKVDKAQSYREIGNYDAAVKLLRSVAEEYAPAWTILGNTYRALKQFDLAEQAFQRAIADFRNTKDPLGKFGEVEAYANLGTMHWRDKGNTAQALEFYECALDIKATFPSDVHFMTGQREIIEQIVPNVYLDLCLLFGEQGQYSKAKRWAKLRLKAVDNCPQATLIYGLAKLDEYVNSDVIYQFISTDEKCRGLEAAISALRVASSGTKSTSVAKEHYAIALLCFSATGYVASRTELSVKTHAELAGLIRDMALREWEWNNFRRITGLVFEQLDKFLADRPHDVRDITSDFTFWARPDACTISFPSFGFAIKRDDDGMPSVGVDPKTPEGIENLPYALAFVESYGGYLVAFAKNLMWAVVEQCFRTWLDECDRNK
jgi:hypothetical protein